MVKIFKYFIWLEIIHLLILQRFLSKHITCIFKKELWYLFQSAIFGGGVAQNLTIVSPLVVYCNK